MAINITLPETYHVTEDDATESVSSNPSTKILIVDDNQEMLDFLTIALKTSYHCMTALNGEDAFKIACSQDVNLVITDQMMPGIDGTELCYRLRHNHATETLPIIMLTAKDDADTEIASIRSGADVFMPKPFNMRKLELHIVQLLQRRKAMEQNVRISTIAESIEVEEALTGDEELMKRVVSLINSNMYLEDFNVTRLCELLCMDQKQLYRKLKQLTGETPVGFIRKQRMRRAALLLKQDRFTIAEVMYQIGFSSQSYFTKSFMKEYGVAPKDYSESVTNS
ncbi:MAG: DNA-binding response regulator [Prevotella sp.]|nr:DNA-binding response regulator [Prevotella sp.]